MRIKNVSKNPLVFADGVRLEPGQSCEAKPEYEKNAGVQEWVKGGWLETEEGIIPGSEIKVESTDDAKAKAEAEALAAAQADAAAQAASTKSGKK